MTNVLAPLQPHLLEMRPRPAIPVLKWAGGKTQLFSRLALLFPTRFVHYHESFLGRGKVFLYADPAKNLFAILYTFGRRPVLREGLEYWLSNGEPPTQEQIIPWIHKHVRQGTISQVSGSTVSRRAHTLAAWFQFPRVF